MIENLKGVYETVNFKKQSGIKLYLNDSLTDYPLHWHTPIEIVAPEKGHYHVTCADRDYDLNEGDILFIAPGTLHSMSPEGEQGSRAIIQIDTSTIRGVRNTDSILSFISPSFLVTEEAFEKELYAAIRFFIWRIKVEYNGDNPFFEPAIYGIFLNILSLIGQSKAYKEKIITEQCTKNREYVEKFLTICDYINEHCAEDLTLEEMAGMAGFSKYHFSRLFKQFTNVSFYQYLSQSRIHNAEKMLSSSDNSITVIAYKSGFTTLSSFIRMFKLIKGVTPSEYRAMYIGRSPAGIM